MINPHWQVVFHMNNCIQFPIIQEFRVFSFCYNNNTTTSRTRRKKRAQKRPKNDKKWPSLKILFRHVAAFLQGQRPHATCQPHPCACPASQVRPPACRMQWTNLGIHIAPALHLGVRHRVDRTWESKDSGEQKQSVIPWFLHQWTARKHRQIHNLVTQCNFCLLLFNSNYAIATISSSVQMKKLWMALQILVNHSQPTDGKKIHRVDLDELAISIARHPCNTDKQNHNSGSTAFRVSKNLQAAKLIHLRVS